jgi:hypothetical protein
MGVSVYLFGSQWTGVSFLELLRTVWPSFVAYICRTMCPNSWSYFGKDGVRIHGVKYVIKRWVFSWRYARFFSTYMVNFDYVEINWSIYCITVDGIFFADIVSFFNSVIFFNVIICLHNVLASHLNCIVLVNYISS